MRDAENTPRAQFPGDRPGRPGVADGPASFTARAYRLPGAGARTPPRPGATGGDEDEPGYVIHLPVRVADLAAATALAGTVATSLSFLIELDAGETTVSTADDQNNRHRVFCDLLLPDRSRCPQRFEHEGPCGEPPSAPEPRPASR